MGTTRCALRRADASGFTKFEKAKAEIIDFQLTHVTLILVEQVELVLVSSGARKFGARDRRRRCAAVPPERPHDIRRRLMEVPRLSA